MAPTSGRPVTGTYRLQLHADFGFADAEAQVPYLADLGVSHLYLSPILTAVAGSMHGYDVLDHTSVSAALGGETGLRALAATAHDHGLGLVVDIVPNHMALPAPEWDNAPLWQVLRDGPSATTAPWFDIDWAAGGGRLGLPLLGDSLENTIAAGELVIGMHDGAAVVRYHDHAFPLAEGTAPARREGGEISGPELTDLLARQHYRLSSWRDRDTVMNYRRFFEVDQLIGVRVEDPAVFEATHRLLLDLHQEGLIDGFRIDHPDGLADPEGYLARLSAACRPDTPVWVEKILEGDERLPESWAGSGTTGYDGLQAISSALVDPATVDVVSSTWLATGGSPDLDPVVQEAKRQAVDQLLQPELNRLVRRAGEALPGIETTALRAALTELLVAIDVYRAYMRPGQPATAESMARLDEGVVRAKAARPDLGEATDALAGLAARPEAVGATAGSGAATAEAVAAAVDFAVRFQQTCGPVMAKGIEDCAFYRWQRLVALNEVGADPTAGQRPSADALHDWARRQQRDRPSAMVARSTHDTKRSEDVRARLLAVAGDPKVWQECSAAFAHAADEAGVDRPTAHLLWQTLVGAGPLDADRLLPYVVKSVREAKLHTAWIDGDEDYERRVLDLAKQSLRGGPLAAVVNRAVSSNANAIRATVLATALLGLCLPGVPDTYQGCEVVDLSLVDPDNRRPVDYPARVERLARLAAGSAPESLDDEKLLVTSRTLRLRRRHPEWFDESADYVPLPTTSPHALGFTRGDRIACLVTRAPNSLAVQGGWDDQTVDLPDGSWRDELSGRTHHGGAVPCRDLLGTLPVALLVRAEGQA